MTGIITKNTGRASGVVGTSAGGVPAVTSDPPTADLNEGDMWLRTDSTTDNLKAYLSSPASFAAGPAYPVSVYVAYGSGVNTDALFLGGNAPGSVNNAVGWNGSAFSNKPNYPTEVYGQHMAVNSPGSSQTIAGGRDNPGPGALNTVNTWDGSSFSSAPSLSSARYIGCSGGTSSALKVCSGDPGVGTAVEDWNGSSWSSGTAMPVANLENGMNIVGPASAMIIAGGRDGSDPYPGVGYIWNGSSWSTTASKYPGLPTSHAGNGSNFGSGSSCLYSGNQEYPPGTNVVSQFGKWNGSSWSTDGTNPRAKPWTGTCSAGNSATSGSGIISPGSQPGAGTNTDTYTYGLAVTVLND